MTMKKKEKTKVDRTKVDATFSLRCIPLGATLSEKLCPVPKKLVKMIKEKTDTYVMELTLLQEVPINCNWETCDGCDLFITTIPWLRRRKHLDIEVIKYDGNRLVELRAHRKGTL